MIIEREQQLRLLKNVHLAQGHGGSRGLTYFMTQRFYWPRMTEDVKNLTSACQDCQAKTSRHIDKIQQELHPVEIPFGHTWDQIGIDLMLMPITEDGYRYIMTAVD